LDPPERVLKPNGTTLEGRVNTTVRLTDISWSELTPFTPYISYISRIISNIL
jgi:hypothetical protein